MMKQRAGLGKKVSSIFDGVPLPKSTQDIEQVPTRPQKPVPPAHRPADVTIEPRQMPTVPPPAPPPVPKPPAVTPPVQAARPAVPTVPVEPRVPKISDKTPPKAAIGSSASDGGISIETWQRLLHKFFFPGSSDTNARNRRAIALMGLLSVVLVVVVTWSGVFSGSPKKVDVVASAGAATNGDSRVEWSRPDPITLARDPMIVGSTSKPAKAGLGNGEWIGGLTVTGIIVSDRSSATINGKIYNEGQKIDETDTAIIKIYPNEVEFSANGKTWKQGVGQ
jgi:hypothetical protein